MIGELHVSYPTVQIPPVNFTGAHSPSDFSPSAFAAALHRYLPSNSEPDPDGSDSFSCDEFRMYEFKVRRCVRGRSHDWTECPFAHPGEKARRRDPRRHRYSGTACSDFRKGACINGDSCEFAHGVFECWLHPTRYRTQPCKDGAHCTRRVCFFAHSPAQLRIPAESPPMSPPGRDSVSELVGGMRGLQIEKVNNLSRFQLSAGSPRTGPGYGPDRFFDTWNLSMEEEPAMERVESGKKLRAAMYAKLRRENFMDRVEPAGPGPDLGWVSELVK